MAKILVLTNIEQQFEGFIKAKQTLREANIAAESITVELIYDAEPWSEKWEKKYRDTKMVLFIWMGTGLQSKFLKDSSDFLRAKQIAHLFRVADPKDEVLDLGLTSEEIGLLHQYLSYGGLNNYRNLLSWMFCRFIDAAYPCEEPRSLPWHGIYHPQSQTALTDVSVYRCQYCLPERPTIAIVFAREDWVWGNTACCDAVIAEIERQQCNVMAVFCSRGDGSSETSGLDEAFEHYFFDNANVCIDALLNTFVFSLTVGKFLKLTTLLQVGVPVLQAYNLYNSLEWWKCNFSGMSASEISYGIAMPEFDGIIHSVPMSTREETDMGSHAKQPMLERIELLIRKARKWAILRHKSNSEKKVGIVFHNYPPTNSNIGSASCLDSPESVRLLLAEMGKLGYSVDHVPENSQVFMDELISHATNDRRFITERQIREADGKLLKEQYRKYFDGLPPETRQQLTRDWGEAPGDVFFYDGAILVPGMLNGNVYVTVQPPRGFGEDPGKIYHSPDCAPTHHYIGVYAWLRDVWQADVVIHVGTHGSLEWLPGKGVAMSNGCYPEVVLGDLPNIYPYWITCVGEGIQAKRRSAACLISYLSSPMSVSGTYEELAELEKLLEEYCHFKQDAGNTPIGRIEELIREKVRETHLDEDVPEAAAKDFDEYVGNLHVFLTDIKNMQMKIGLHTLGRPPEGEHLIEFLLALTKLDNGDTPSLTKTLAGMFGFDFYELLENSGKMLPDGSKTYGMLIDEIREKCREVILLLNESGFDDKRVDEVFSLPWTRRLTGELRERFAQVVLRICTHMAPALQNTTLEMTNLLAAMQGAYVEPGPSGAPTSGGADLLPTGRNFYSIDPQCLPTPAAWEIGKQMAEDVIERFVAEEGKYPESVGIILWATSNLRNHGQCVAEFLYLMGLRPVWQKVSLRVVGIEVIPLAELRRPRVDVTGRISGLFRDSMPASVSWMDKAVDMVAKLDESLTENFVRKHVLHESQELEESGLSPADAWRQASFRIFGDPPGAFGAGVGSLLEAKNWESIDDIAKVYVRWGGHAYGAGSDGAYMPERFSRRLQTMDITLQNVDHRESSMLSGDDYNSYRGGMVAAVRSVKGEMPRNYVSDSSDRSKVLLRSLSEELKRWFRGEAMNPKYIEGMKNHGYKGAGDLSTYVAVSYQWDATSAVMEDWMYEKYAEKYAFDPAMQEWMREVNPWALHRIAETLLEADQRGLWQAKPETKAELQKLFLEIEGELEGRSDE